MSSDNLPSSFGIVGRKLKVSVSDAEAGTYTDLPGVVDYDLTEVDDNETTSVATPDGAFQVAGIPAPGGCVFTVANLLRHLSVVDTIFDAQRAATPLWWRIAERNAKADVAAGVDAVNEAAVDTSGVVTLSGTSPTPADDKFAPGMVFESGSFRVAIKSVESATGFTLAMAPMSQAIAATDDWQVRWPSVRRTWEGFPIGHTLRNAVAGTLAGTLRVAAARPIPKPVLVAKS